MSSSSGSSPPLFPGNEAGSTSSNSNGSSSSAGNGDGKSNYLWLLFLIPIVLLALGLGLTLWYVCRRRRIRKARRSTLRNVTLVVQDEEKAREREERRLTRGDSVASKVLRRGSTLKQKREQRYSKRIARAVAQEEGVNEKVGKRYHEKLPSDSSAQTTDGGSAPRTALPLGRKASVKHRDREIAQRVWRIPGDEMGERPLSPRALTRDLEAAGALSSDGEDGADSSAEHKTDGYDSGKDLSDVEQQPPRSSVGGHVRPGTRRKDDANILSVIGESGLSQGDPSADVNQAEAEASPVAAAAPITHPAPAATGAGLASAASLNRNVSQRSAYTTATSRSRYTTADETDNQSMRTAETSGTAVPAAREEAEQAPAATPRAAAARLSRHDSDVTDPFRSPDTAGTSSTHTNPFADSKRADSGGAGPAAQPPVAVPAIITTETSPPPTAGMDPPASPPAVPAATAAAPVGGGGVSLARKLSDVVRLKTPTPNRHRTPSPAASGSRRSMSISSRSSRGKVPQATAHDLSLHKTPSSPKAARLFRRMGESPSTAKPSGNGLHAGESWAYTSRASEWKRSSVPNVAGASPNASATSGAGGSSGLAVPMPPFLSKTKRRSQSSTSLGNTRHSRSGSSSVSSDPPHVPGERVWLAPEVEAASKDPVVATPVKDGQSTSPPPPPSTSATTTTPAAAPGASGVQRKPSLGVAGSRFKETFE